MAVDIVYLNFKNVFDKVPHRRLSALTFSPYLIGSCSEHTSHVEQAFCILSFSFYVCACAQSTLTCLCFNGKSTIVSYMLTQHSNKQVNINNKSIIYYFCKFFLCCHVHNPHVNCFDDNCYLSWHGDQTCRR